MSIPLRNGQITRDVRLGRLTYFDPRSKQYQIINKVAQTNLKTTLWNCNTHLNQGREGACVGFGCVHELISTPVPAILDDNYAQMVYTEAKKIDPWEGEDYIGTSVLAGVEVIRRLGWIEGYYWAFSFSDFLVGLSNSGPAVIGVRWTQGMKDPNNKGFIKPTGRFLGEHCLIVKGIDIDKEFITLHNSWGPRWGMQGDCYISFNDMKILLEDKGEAVFFTGRKNILDV